MATTIQATPEQMEKTAATIEALAADYKAQYDALYHATDDMKSTWGGKDNVKYIDQINGFKDDFEKMQNLMKNYADFLRKSAVAYRKTQDDIMAQAGNLRN